MLAGETVPLGFQPHYGLLTMRSHLRFLPPNEAGLGCVLPTLVLLEEISLPQHSNPDPRQSLMLLFVLPRGEGTEGARLSEIYAKLEEIEADKAPAR